MRYFLLFTLGLLISCQPTEKTYSGEEILEKSIQKHDPKGQWSTAEFSFRIQEPRLQNPVRYSEVSLNNKTGAFELKRNREDKIASYSIDPDGLANVFLNNEAVLDSTEIKRYLLQTTRVNVYQTSYQTMLGLPMSLKKNFIEKFGTVSKENFNGKQAYKVALELKKAMFSKHWKVYFSTEDFQILGIDLVSLEDPNDGERLYFDKTIQIDQISIPRMKHWYDLQDNYLGSDVIVKKLN